MRNHRTLAILVFAAAALVWLYQDAAAQRPDWGRRGGFRFGGGRSQMEEKPADDKDKDKDKKDEKEGEKKPEESKPEEKKDEGPPPVTRPLMPDRPADPRELGVMPDADGKIKFSFKGQPWPSVLEWLADISDMSLEWEEAPAGYCDLTTRGSYSVDEVRDLLNSYLLAKGFTVMRNGELLIVVNLRKLDNSLVPRVAPSELEARGTYDIVRTFFDLDWLVAEQAAEEIKPLLSPYGKVTALKSTNRLDVLDTAGNLRRIREMLAEEQSDSGQQRLVREFKLQHTRAEEVLDTLNVLLGIESKQNPAASVDPRQLMQAMLMAQQGGGQGMPQPGKKESGVYLAVNARENSILAYAPPDKMGVIEQAVEAVDVPRTGGKGFMADAQRVKVYRLSGLQPVTMAKVLKELGSLDPTTKLEIDEKKNALIVYAPLADHLLITDLVERLDGASRKFEVIQLRTLSAEYVAGSIMTLMNGPEKQDDSNRRRYYFFDSSSQQQDNGDKFWVEADVERNRLLLRANDVELTEVRALLVKLGEIPADQRYGNTTRVVPVSPNDGLLDAIDQLRSQMPNPIEVEINPNALRPPRRLPQPGDEDPSTGRRRAPMSEPAGPGPESGQMRGSGDRPQRRDRGFRSTQAPKPVSRFHLAQDRAQAPAAPADTSNDDTSNEAERDAAADHEPDKNDSEAISTASDEPAADAEVAPEVMDGQDPTDQAEQTADEAVDEAPADGAGIEAAETGAQDPPPAEESADDAAASEPPPSELPHERRSLPADLRDDLPMDPSELPRRAHAPIRIRLTPQGLEISSSDTDALDRLEGLLNSALPPKRTYEFFTLKHTYAKDMVALLKDIFKAEMGKDASSRTEVFDMFWNGRGGSSGQQARTSLSRRRPLSFVADPVTNTVLVQGADAAQLAEIEDLIARYDRAEPPNSESVRRTKRVALKYAKAKEVAEIIKDVYRDLLSPNDKALQSGQPQQQPGRERSNNENFYSAMFSYLTDDPTKSEVVPRFKGMLSVGIDERANGVVISAPQILLTDVLEMVAAIDADARPTRPVVRLLRVKDQGTAAQVKQAIGAQNPAALAAGDASSNGGSTLRVNPNAGNVRVERMEGGGTRVSVSKQR